MQWRGLFKLPSKEERERLGFRSVSDFAVPSAEFQGLVVVLTTLQSCLIIFHALLYLRCPENVNSVLRWYEGSVLTE